MKTYDKESIPYKLTLTHKLFNTKYVIYRTETEYIAYNEQSFNCEIQETPRTTRKVYQMRSMF